jgi:hypothetical protein
MKTGSVSMKKVGSGLRMKVCGFPTMKEELPVQALREYRHLLNVGLPPDPSMGKDLNF